MAGEGNLPEVVAEDVAVGGGAAHRAEGGGEGGRPLAAAINCTNIVVKNNYNWGAVTAAMNAAGGIIGIGDVGLDIRNNVHAKGSVAGGGLWEAAIASALGSMSSPAANGHTLSNNFWELPAPGYNYDVRGFNNDPSNVRADNFGYALIDLGTTALPLLNDWITAQPDASVYKVWTLDTDGYPVFGLATPQVWGPGVPQAPPALPTRNERPVFFSGYTLSPTGVMDFHVNFAALLPTDTGYMLYGKINLPDAQWEAIQFYPKTLGSVILEPLTLWKNGQPYRFFKIKIIGAN
jgi:hypothetical protein